MRIKHINSIDGTFKFVQINSIFESNGLYFQVLLLKIKLLGMELISTYVIHVREKD